MTDYLVLQFAYLRFCISINRRILRLSSQFEIVINITSNRDTYIYYIKWLEKICISTWRLCVHTSFSESNGNFNYIDRTINIIMIIFVMKNWWLSMKIWFLYISFIQCRSLILQFQNLLKRHAHLDREIKAFDYDIKRLDKLASLMTKATSRHQVKLMAVLVRISTTPKHWKA